MHAEERYHTAYKRGMPSATSFEGTHKQYMRLCQKQQCNYRSHAYGTRSYVSPHLLVVVHVPDVHIYAARLICCQPGV